MCCSHCTAPVNVASKRQEFDQLPRPYKQRRRCNTKILREATAFKELPSVLMPTADRRIPLPPLVHYGFPFPLEQLEDILERKLNLPPRVLSEIDPFTPLFHLEREVFCHPLKFQAVYLDGTDSMSFIAVSSNWEPSESKRLGEVVKELKEFLEVDGKPVWCLDSDFYYWSK